MPDSALPPCSIPLPAGGRGQRIGGRDKGLIEQQDLPLITHLHRLMRLLANGLIIPCNHNREHYVAYTNRLVSDGSRDFPGSLADIRAGLAVAWYPWLLVLSCDASCIDRTLLEALLQAAGRTPARPWILYCSGQWGPPPSPIPTHLAEEVEHTWCQGNHSPRHVLLPFSAKAIELVVGGPRLASLNIPGLLTNHRELK